MRTKRLKLQGLGIIILTIFAFTNCFSQVAINTNGAAPNSKSMLDITSTDKGVLLPRMTSAQRIAIASPPTGLIVFQTDATSGFYYYTGSVWQCLSTSTGTVTGTGTSGQVSYWDGTTSQTSSANLTLNSGTLQIGSSGTDGILKLYSEQGTTDYTVTIQPSTNTAANFTITLPTNVGSNGQVLSTTGSGNLAWTNPSESGTPSGVIMQYAGSSAPTGYLICNGSAVSRTTYSNLFAVIGTTYGAGDGSTTFNLPDLRGRFPVGYYSSDASFDALNEKSGEKTHTITSAELPAHTHSVDPPSTTTSSDGSHTHDYKDYYNDSELSDDANQRTVGSDDKSYSSRTSEPNGAHTHTLNIASFNSGSTGTGTAMNVLPPYIVLNYIIKY